MSRLFWKHLGILLSIVVLASVLCLSLNHWDNKYTRPGTQPVNGVLTLSQKEVDQGGAHFLINDWRFYPNVLLTPELYAETGASRYMVYTSVGERTNFRTENGNDPHGCGTYVLTLDLPEQTNSYSLYLPEIYSAYKLYLDDKQLLQLGNPDEPLYEDRLQERVISFDAGGTHTLMIAVSDYSHFYSGIVYPPALGSAVAINYMRGTRFGLILCVSMLELIIATVALYMALRMNVKGSLLFVMLCLTGAMHTVCPLLHGIFELSIQPWYAIEIFSGYAMTLLVIILQNHFCEIPERIRRISQLLGAAFCIAALCYGLLSAYLTVSMIELFSVASVVYKLSAAVYLLAISMYALHQQTIRSTRLFYASLFYTLLLIWDRLLPSYEPVLSTWFSEWGSMVLILVVGTCLWRELVSTYAQRMTFAEEHRQMARQLYMQMEYTEEIRQRTEENRRLIHDFRQHLRTITALSTQVESTPNTSDTQKELLNYLEEMPRATLSGASPAVEHFCNRAAVDALLQYYHSSAVRQGVDAKLSLHIPEGIALSDIDWCSVLGNLLENALEACERMEGGPKRLVMSSQQIVDTLFIKVENTYDGRYRRRGNGFLSRKTERVRAGIGLESAKDIITRNGGSMDVYPEAEVFAVGITLPVHLPTE